MFVYALGMYACFKTEADSVPPSEGFSPLFFLDVLNRLVHLSWLHHNPRHESIYWDDSNIFIRGRSVAADKEGEDTRFRVRIHYDNLLILAHAN